MLWLLLLLLILPFAVVPFLGAPYVPSKTKSLVKFLSKLGVKSGQNLVDLGSGDGSVLVRAGKQLGLDVYGVELNPFLVAFSRLRLAATRQPGKVVYGNLWSSTIPKSTDVIYAFIMPKHMAKLEKKIEAEISKPVTVVTYSFEFPGRKPLDKSDGFLAYRFKPLAKNGSKD